MSKSNASGLVKVTVAHTLCLVKTIVNNISNLKTLNTIKKKLVVDSLKNLS